MYCKKSRTSWFGKVIPQEEIAVKSWIWLGLIINLKSILGKPFHFSTFIAITNSQQQLALWQSQFIILRKPIITLTLLNRNKQGCIALFLPFLSVSYSQQTFLLSVCTTILPSFSTYTNAYTHSAHTPDNSFMGFVSEELNETAKRSIQQNKVNNMAVVYGKEASMWKVVTHIHAAKHTQMYVCNHVHIHVP